MPVTEIVLIRGFLGPLTRGSTKTLQLKEIVHSVFQIHWKYSLKHLVGKFCSSHASKHDLRLHSEVNLRCCLEPSVANRRVRSVGADV